MRRFLTAVIFATVPAAAIAEPIVVPSAGSVSETVERLKASVENAGAQVLGVVDFGGGMRSIGEDIGDMQLVIFGDPRIGIQALSADPMAALDLPGKVLVYGTAESSAMAYQSPAEMLAEWNIPGDAPVLQVMARTLESITTAAAK